MEAINNVCCGQRMKQRGTSIQFKIGSSTHSEIVSQRDVGVSLAIFIELGNHLDPESTTLIHSKASAFNSRVTLNQIPHTCLGAEESQHRGGGHAQSPTLTPAAYLLPTYISIAYSSKSRNCLLIGSLIHSIAIRCFLHPEKQKLNNQLPYKYRILSMEGEG